MEKVNSNPECVKKLDGMKAEADAAVTAFRDQAMNRAMFFIRAKKHGATPLDALLEISAGGELRENARVQTRSEKPQGDMEFYARWRRSAGDGSEAFWHSCQHAGKSTKSTEMIEAFVTARVIVAPVAVAVALLIWAMA